MAIRNQSGFTIIEIMIALSLGVLLSAALVQILGSSSNLAAMENSLSRMQETGRFALEAMAKDVRSAGYQGCADPNDLDMKVIAQKFDDETFSGTAIAGYEVAADGTFSPALVAGSAMEDIQGAPGSADTVARPGSDVISISYANIEEAELDDPSGTSANIKLTANPSGLSQGDFAIISDCKSAHLFEITNVTNSGGRITFAHASSGNTTNMLEPEYFEAQLMSFENRVYFVADTGRTTDSGANVYSLYVREFDSAPQEILEGVESLQILYGEQLDSGQIRYVKADDANLDLEQVVSVRIGLLVQSFAQVADSNDLRTYELPGASVSNVGVGAHAGDRALRKPFSATIKLRNRRQEI